MALTVNGVCRFTVLQTLEANQVANVLDMRIDTTGSSMAREDAIQDQAEVIFRQWVADILPQMVDDIQLEGVQWLDLNSATGSTGTVVSDGVNNAPVRGLTDGSPLPANTSVLVQKTLESAGRGRRNGRMYLAGFAESQTESTNGNLLGAANLVSLNTSLAAFLDNINQNTIQVDDYDSNLCVVHVATRDGEGRPLTGISTDVGALVADQLLATQRRRLRR